MVIKRIYQGKSVDYITKLANKLSERDNIICLFAIKNKEKANIILSASKNIGDINMGNLFREFSEVINGKGGGSKTLAQGIGEANKIEEFLNKIYEFCCSTM